MINVNLNKSQLEDLLKYKKELQSTRLETLGRTNKISNTFEALEKLQRFKDIKDILEIIAGYHINVLEYEMKEGLRILIKARFLLEVLEIFSLLLSQKRILEEHIVISITATCFSSNDINIINKAYNSVILYYNLNKNISHSFWQSSIDGLLRIKQYNLANVLIKLYPIKYSYSESLWKKIIVSNMSQNFEEIFDLFKDKYESRAHNDDCRGFESIFNIFVEEVANNFEKIDLHKIEMFFSTLIKNKIFVKESQLEKFLIKVVNNYKNNYSKVEEYLIKSDCMLTKRIIEKLVEEFSKLNDNFSVYSIFKLCKSKKIPVAYESLNIQSKCLKELLKFILDKTELKFEGSFFSNLSQNNQSYVIKNFTQPESITDSLKNSTEKNYFQEESKSISVSNEENQEQIDKIKKVNNVQQIFLDYIKKEPSKINEHEEEKIEDGFVIY